MWGEYDTYDGKRCKVEIDFSHSKDKRPDKKQLKLITKMPETTMLAKELICESVVRKALLPQVKFKTAQGKECLYAVDEKKVNYKGIPLTASVCYSNNLS